MEASSNNHGYQIRKRKKPLKLALNPLLHGSQGKTIKTHKPNLIFLPFFFISNRKSISVFFNQSSLFWV
ncbi:hypothetical protein L1887_08217 [Cichorium endivia]|nr:hypothetical protein L1887_08217 [Cichorium endivia]